LFISPECDGQSSRNVQDSRLIDPQSNRMRYILKQLKSKFFKLTMEPSTLLFINAARTGDLETIRQIIAEGIGLEVKNDQGYTALIIACYNHQLEAARLLMDTGADVNGYDFGQNTALMGACFKGYHGIAELLIERNADLDFQHGNGGTALMFASIFWRNGIVKLLLDSGADKNILDLRGVFVYDLAAQQGNEKAIELLEQSL
jgi:ankyrin repeat protein